MQNFTLLCVTYAKRWPDVEASLFPWHVLYLQHQVSHTLSAFCERECLFAEQKDDQRGAWRPVKASMFVVVNGFDLAIM